MKHFYFFRNNRDVKETREGGHKNRLYRLALVNPALADTADEANSDENDIENAAVIKDSESEAGEQSPNEDGKSKNSRVK